MAVVWRQLGAALLLGLGSVLVAVLAYRGRTRSSGLAALVVGALAVIVGWNTRDFFASLGPDSAQFMVVPTSAIIAGLIAVGAGVYAMVASSQGAGPTSETTTCPHCAETILAAAKVCKHCGRDVA